MRDTENRPYVELYCTVPNTRDPMIFGNNYQAHGGGRGAGGVGSVSAGNQSRTRTQVQL